MITPRPKRERWPFLCVENESVSVDLVLGLVILIDFNFFYRFSNQYRSIFSESARIRARVQLRRGHHDEPHQALRRLVNGPQPGPKPKPEPNPKPKP